jgi:phage shock protein A
MKETLYNKIKAKRAFKKVFQNYQNTYEAVDDADILKQKMDDFQDKLTSMNENCNQMEEHIKDINTLLNQIQEAYNQGKKEENETEIIDTSKKSNQIK